MAAAWAMGIPPSARPANAEAPASPTKEAAAPHFQRGASLYEGGHFDEAIVEFERAYQLDPDPVMLFNIAQCHRRARRPDRALFFYRRFVEQAPRAPNRSDAERHVREIERSLLDEELARRRAQDTPRPPAQVAAPGPGEEPAPRSRGPEPSWSLSAWGGVTKTSFGRADLDTPLTSTFTLAVGRRWPLEALALEAGLGVQITPLTFVALDGVTEERAWLTGPLAFGAVSVPLAGAWSLAGRLGAGVLWWSGLSAGNPFTFAGAAADGGAVPLPTGQLAAEVRYALGRYGLAVSPSYTLGKTTSEGLTSEIGFVSLFTLQLGGTITF